MAASAAPSAAVARRSDGALATALAVAAAEKRLTDVEDLLALGARPLAEVEVRGFDVSTARRGTVDGPREAGDRVPRVVLRELAKLRGT